MCMLLFESENRLFSARHFYTMKCQPWNISCQTLLRMGACGRYNLSHATMTEDLMTSNELKQTVIKAVHNASGIQGHMGERLGRNVYLELQKLLGGERITMPNNEIREVRNAAIVKEFTGDNHAALMRSVGRYPNVTRFTN